MGKTNLKIEYVLKAANNIGFDNIDTYISKIIFEHYNEVPTYTLEKMLSIYFRLKSVKGIMESTL